MIRASEKINCPILLVFWPGLTVDIAMRSCILYI